MSMPYNQSDLVDSVGKGDVWIILLFLS